MSALIAEGWYQAKILDAILDTTKGGTSFLAVRMTLDIPSEGPRDIVWKLYLTKAAAPYSKAALVRLGYDGGDVEKLSGVALSGLVAKIDHEEYQGKTYYRVGYVKLDTRREAERPKNAKAIKAAFSTLEPAAEDEPAPAPGKRGKPKPAGRKAASPRRASAPVAPPSDDEGDDDYSDNGPDSDDIPF